MNSSVFEFVVSTTIAILVLCVGAIIGADYESNKMISKNHNTQEFCEYNNETKCVNAWIPETMQNPKSIEVKK